MNNRDDGSIPQNKPPKHWRTVLQGLILGMVASFVGIGGLLFVDAFVIEPIVHPNLGNPWNTSWDTLKLLYFPIFFFFNVLFLDYYAIGPAAIGGAMSGFVLQRLASHGRLNMWLTTIVGAGVGFSAGLATAALMVLTVDPSSDFSPIVDPIWAGVMGAVVGLFYSWLLSRWLHLAK